MARWPGTRPYSCCRTFLPPGRLARGPHCWPGGLLNEVAPGLFAGRRPLAGELPSQVLLVVDLAAEFIECRAVRTACRYISAPVLDTGIMDEAAFVALVQEVAQWPGPVYIHCAQGHGRTGTLAAAGAAGQGPLRQRGGGGWPAKCRPAPFSPGETPNCNSCVELPSDCCPAENLPARHRRPIRAIAARPFDFMAKRGRGGVFFGYQASPAGIA